MTPPTSGPTKSPIANHRMRLVILSDVSLQTIISDVCATDPTGEKKITWQSIRMRWLAIGLFVGPLVGGVIAPYVGFPLLACVVGLLHLGSAVWVSRLNVEEPNLSSNAANSVSVRSKLEALNNLSNRVEMMTLLLVRFIQSFGFHLTTSVFGAYLRDGLGATASEMGFCLSYIGFTMFLMQFVVPSIARHIPPHQQLPVALAFVSIGRFVIYHMVSAPFDFYIYSIPYLLGQSFYLPVMSSLLASTVGPASASIALSLAQSLESFAAVIAPAVAGMLITTIGPTSNMLAGGVLTAISLLLILMTSQSAINTSTHSKQ